MTTIIASLAFVALLAAVLFTISAFLRMTNGTCMDCGERARLDEYLRCPACRFVNAQSADAPRYFVALAREMAMDKSWRRS